MGGRIRRSGVAPGRGLGHVAPVWCGVVWCGADQLKSALRVLSIQPAVEGVSGMAGRIDNALTALFS